MQQSKKEGMVLLDDCIADLCRKRLISKTTAIDFAADKVAIAAKL
jgi:Tfp pilus assembly pilus retraction ATPase PilT